MESRRKKRNVFVEFLSLHPNATKIVTQMTERTKNLLPALVIYLIFQPKNIPSAKHTQRSNKIVNFSSHKALRKMLGASKLSGVPETVLFSPAACAKLFPPSEVIDKVANKLFQFTKLVPTLETTLASRF